MTTTPHADEQLAALASYLAARREAILQAWRKAVKGDPELVAASALSISQFNNDIPEFLDAFEHKLCARQSDEKMEAGAEQKKRAAEHGLNRWHHGYEQRQVMREWGHLHLCLLDELESYAAGHSPLDATAMPAARRALAQLCSDGVNESATKFFRLQQVEAASRVRDLEQAVKQLRELQRRRAEVWREAAHDLRGNVGVVKNATAVLIGEGLTESERSEFTDMLQRSVDSLHTLLDDLISLARLEAGHERRKIDTFDAGAMLNELCAAMQSIARERALFLLAEGPATLSTQGDAVKCHRIAQNLLLNALKYTEHGGVKVSWGDLDADGPERWLLCVQDTGPGFDDGSATPLAHALKEATEEAQAEEENAAAAGEISEPVEPPPTLASQSSQRPQYQAPGEGIGLSIVKRLCEFLDASLELETKPGEGSTFRVLFPHHYPAP